MTHILETIKTNVLLGFIKHRSNKILQSFCNLMTYLKCEIAFKVSLSGQYNAGERFVT